MRLKDTALKVVVPTKLNKTPEGYFLVPYPKNLIVGDDIEGGAYNNAIDKTLQSELPDVGECVEFDVEKLLPLIEEFSRNAHLRATIYTPKSLSKAIASCKDVVKWKEER